MIEAYVISRPARDAVRAHADRALPGGYEVGGELLVEQDRLVQYRPVENNANEPGWFQPAQSARWPWIQLHTHPGPWTGLSHGDFDWMRHLTRPIATYAPDYDRMTVWVLDPSRESGVRGIRVVVEERARMERRHPLRRPGRRG